MSCCGEFKSEFQCKKFGFGNKSPEKFVKAGCGPRIFYPLWTIFWLLYHLAWFGYDIYIRCHDSTVCDPYYFTKLTNWSYILLTFFNLVDMICSIYVYCTKRNQSYDFQETDVSMPWYLQLNWFLFEVVNASAIAITILFYGLLTPKLHPLDIEHHAINSVYVLLNFFVSAKPVRVLHTIYPSIYGLIFSIFSAIYQLGGDNPPIYSFMDWENPGKAIVYVVILTCAVVPAIHLTFFGLYLFRSFLHEKCCNTKNPIDEETGNKEP